VFLLLEQVTCSYNCVYEMLTLCKCVEVSECDPCERPPDDRLTFSHYVKHVPIQPLTGFVSCGSDVGTRPRNRSTKSIESVDEMEVEPNRSQQL
jgi:hypothetical protein